MAKKQTGDTESSPPISVPAPTPIVQPGVVPMPAFDQAAYDASEAARQAAWAAEHPNTGGLFSDIANAVGSAANAVGSVAGTVVDAAGAALQAAQNSVVAQALAAAATGGLSLAVQAGVETATGSGGPVTGTIAKAVNDPLDLLSELPGVVLTQTGLPGAVLDVARGVGGAAAEVFGEDSAVGQVAGAVRDAAAGVQQQARDNPVAAVEVAAGAAALALGLPGGGSLLNNGLNQILGGGSSQPEPQQAAPESPAAPVPSAPVAAAPTGTGPNWTLVGGALLGLTGVGLVGWAIASSAGTAKAKAA